MLGGNFQSQLSIEPSSVPGLDESGSDWAFRWGFVAAMDPSGQGTALRAIRWPALGVAKLPDGSVLAAGALGHDTDFDGCRMTFSPDPANVGDGFLVSTDSTGACQWALHIATMTPNPVYPINPPFESDYIS